MRFFCLPIFLFALLFAVAALCLPAGSNSAPPDKYVSREATETREHIRRLERLAKAPAPEGAFFWEAWVAFKLAHAGRPEYAEGAALLRQAPSPLDELDRCDIPAAERLPCLPAEVVAVLGEHRALHGGEGQLSISADGLLVAEGGQVWEAATMTIWAWLSPGPWERYSAAAFSPKGRLLAAAYSKGITLWDLSGKTPVRMADLEGLTKGVAGLAWSGDGKTLVCLGRVPAEAPEKVVVVWDLGGPRPRRRRTFSLDWSVGRAIALSSDGRWLAIDGMNLKSTFLWDLSDPDNQEPTRLELHNVRAPRFSPDSRILLADDGAGRRVRLWKLTESGPREATNLFIRYGAPLAFSPDGKLLVEVGLDPDSSASRDGEVRIALVQNRILRQWDAEAVRQGKLRAARNPNVLPFIVYEIAFFPDSKRVAFRTGGRVVLWDLERGRPCLEYSSHQGAVRARFAPDGRSLGSGGFDGGVYWWDLTAKPPREREALRWRFNAIHDLQFAPQGGYMACLGNDRRDDGSVFRLWSLAGNRMNLRAVERPFSAGISRIAFAPDGRSFAAAGLENPSLAKEVERPGPFMPKVCLWDFREGTLTEKASLSPRENEMNGYPVGWCGSFSADSRAYLFTQSTSLRRWAMAEAGRPEKTVLKPKATRGAFDRLAVSPDGRFWATAEYFADTTLLQVWDVREAAVRRQWTCEFGAGIQALQFAPDGQTLAVLELNAPRLTLMDAASGRKVRELPMLWSNQDIDWAPDGRHIATVGSGPIYIYRLAERGQPLAK
jgi:WD40 repeat protein